MADLAPGVWPRSGLFPAWDGVMQGTLDTKVKASGDGSLRFEIRPFSHANAAGFWRQELSRSFGAGDTFYVQFRQRFSPEMLKNDWGGNTSWKQVIFHGPFATCADVELTTGNYQNLGIPIMYTECGARAMVTNDSNPPYLLQQGDFKCWWGDPRPTGNCLYYPVNQWVTFYYRIAIGDWGKPNSTIQAWVASDGEQYKQWIDMKNYVLNNEAPRRNDYSFVTLLPYMTNKNYKVAGGTTAYTWYDELIVSTQPIAPPVGSAQPVQRGGQSHKQ